MNDNVTPFRNVKLVSLLWAEPERAADISMLHARLFTPLWDEAAIRTLLEHPASTSLIAVAGGSQKSVIGFVIGQLAADEAEILSLAVTPDWQKLGVGKMLVEGLARASRRGEATRVFLEVAEDNVAAIALYRSLGFAEVGRRKRYYTRADAEPADALTLALAL